MFNQEAGLWFLQFGSNRMSYDSNHSEPTNRLKSIKNSKSTDRLMAI